MPHHPVKSQLDLTPVILNLLWLEMTHTVSVLGKNLGSLLVHVQSKVKKQLRLRGGEMCRCLSDG